MGMIYCSCGFQGYELKEYLQKFSNGSIHIRGECPKCNKYLKYVPYSESKICSFLLKELYEMRNNNDYSGIETIMQSVIIFENEKGD